MRPILILGVLAVAAPASAEPDYCKTPDLKKKLDTFGNGVGTGALGDDPYDALPELLGASCGVEAPRYAKELAAARAKWTQRLALTDADWADLLEWAQQDRAHRNNPSPHVDPKQAPSTWDAIDQYAAVIPSAVFDFHYPIDALGNRLTETGRLAYVARCIDSRRNGEWIICQPDVDALDLTKLPGELRAATKHPAADRVAIRLVADRLKPKIAEHKAKMKELAARDPGYAKLFGMSADARKQWAAKPPDGALLELALAMDDARATNSNRAFEGCEDRTWTAFAGALGKLPAAKFKDIKDEPGNPFMAGAIAVVVNDPDAYLGALAYYTCRASKPDVLVKFLGNAMHRWPGFRGPRTSAHTALLAANVKLDDRDARVEYPDLRRMWLTGGEGTRGGGRGVISGAKPGGATTTLEFQQKLRKDTVCVDWKDTNRISMISASGTVYYEYNCTKYGTVTVNLAPKPMTVASRHTGGIKPGVTVAVIEDVVGAVWPKSGAAPSHVFGVAVK